MAVDLDRHRRGAGWLSDPLRNLLVRLTIEQLSEWGSSPSVEHVRGIEDAAQFIAKMASGTAPRVIAISSMSTGMGEVAATTGKVLTSNATYADVGMLVFISTKRDLESMIERMGFTLGPDPRYAVRTGKKNVELNSLGVGAEPGAQNNAQVLFTTQAKFIYQSRYRKNFERDPFWHYRDKPRPVRIWDESIVPVDTMMLSAAQLAELSAELWNRGEDDAAKIVREFAKALCDKPNDSLIRVPTVPLTCPSPEAEEEDGVFAELCATMVWLGGQRVRVYRDEYTGAAISYREALPKLLSPLLVLDANAKERKAYQLWQEGRGGLVHLFSPAKTYNNLTIHIYDHRAGIEAHRDKAYRALVDAATAAFFDAMRDGAERVLFLHNKAEKPSQDMQKLIRKAIREKGGDPSRAVFLHWGLHKSSNEYMDVKHTVAIGVQQAPLYAVAALVHGVSQVAPHEPLNKEHVEGTRQTEMMHTLFQGVGRSAVRRTINGDVPEGTHLYLIASDRGPMRFPRERLGEWFPGARVVEWKPFGTSLRGGRKKTDELPRFVTEAILPRAGGGPFTENDLVREGFGSGKVFRYLRDPDVPAWLCERGWLLKEAGNAPGRGGAKLWEIKIARPASRSPYGG